MGIAPRSEALTVPRGDVPGEISVAFSVLGVGIRLKACPAADIAPVIREYSAFRSDEAHPSWTITWDGHASPTRLTVDDKVHLGIPGKSVSPIISMKIMDRVYQSIEDFYLFHGGAAAWRGVLLVFPGESGTGKSSLSIGLAMKGWRLFSDEVIAISRKSLQAVPFPRAITVWKNARALDEFLFPRGRCPQFVSLPGERMKAVIPFSSFNKPPAPLSPAAVVCLRGGRREVRKGGGQIVVTYWDERMERLARERGFHEHLQIQKLGEFWCIRSDRMEMVEDICTSLGGLVIERELLENGRPTFGKTPLLEPISPSECLKALWSVFENGRALTNRQGGATALYLHLARLVKTMPCFWLRPGPPSPTCELLQNLAQELERRNVSRE